MLEAIEACERIAGRELDWALRTRRGSATTAGGSRDLGEFERDYPAWGLRYDIDAMLREIHDANAEAWRAAAP